MGGPRSPALHPPSSLPHCASEHTLKHCWLQFLQNDCHNMPCYSAVWAYRQPAGQQQEGMEQP